MVCLNNYNSNLCVLIVLVLLNCIKNQDIESEDIKYQFFVDTQTHVLYSYTQDIQNKLNICSEKDFSILEAEKICQELGQGTFKKFNHNKECENEQLQFSQYNCKQDSNNSTEQVCKYVEDIQCKHQKCIHLYCSNEKNDSSPIQEGETFIYSNLLMYNGDNWGLVCDKEFTQENADSICQQHGYKEVKEIKSQQECILNRFKIKQFMCNENKCHLPQNQDHNDNSEDTECGQNNCVKLRCQHKIKHDNNSTKTINQENDNDSDNSIQDNGNDGQDQGLDKNQDQENQSNQQESDNQQNNQDNSENLNDGNKDKDEDENNNEQDIDQHQHENQVENENQNQQDQNTQEFKENETEIQNPQQNEDGELDNDSNQESNQNQTEVENTQQSEDGENNNNIEPNQNDNIKDDQQQNNNDQNIEDGELNTKKDGESNNSNNSDLENNTQPSEQVEEELDCEQYSQFAVIVQDSQKLQKDKKQYQQMELCIINPQLSQGEQFYYKSFVNICNQNSDSQNDYNSLSYIKQIDLNELDQDIIDYKTCIKQKQDINEMSILCVLTECSYQKYDEGQFRLTEQNILQQYTEQNQWQHVCFDQDLYRIIKESDTTKQELQIENFILENIECQDTSIQSQLNIKDNLCEQNKCFKIVNIPPMNIQQIQIDEEFKIEFQNQNIYDTCLKQEFDNFTSNFLCEKIQNQPLKSISYQNITKNIQGNVSVTEIICKQEDNSFEECQFKNIIHENKDIKEQECIQARIECGQKEEEQYDKEFELLSNSTDLSFVYIKYEDEDPHSICMNQDQQLSAQIGQSICEKMYKTKFIAVSYIGQGQCPLEVSSLGKIDCNKNSSDFSSCVFDQQYICKDEDQCLQIKCQQFSLDDEQKFILQDQNQLMQFNKQEQQWEYTCSQGFDNSLAQKYCQIIQKQDTYGKIFNNQKCKYNKTKFTKQTITCGLQDYMLKHCQEYFYDNSQCMVDNSCVSIYCRTLDFKQVKQIENEDGIQVFTLENENICTTGKNKYNTGISICKILGYQFMQSIITDAKCLPNVPFIIGELECKGMGNQKLEMCTFQYHPQCSENSCISVQCTNENPGLQIVQNNDGLTMLYHDNKFWNVCRANLDIQQARVMCRQLNFITYSKIEQVKCTDDSSDSIARAYDCNGDENQLTDCKPGSIQKNIVNCTRDTCLKLECTHDTQILENQIEQEELEKQKLIEEKLQKEKELKEKEEQEEQNHNQNQEQLEETTDKDTDEEEEEPIESINAEKKNITEEIDQEEQNQEKNQEEQKLSQTDILLQKIDQNQKYIIIGAAAFVFIITAYCICKRVCKNKKRKHRNFSDDDESYSSTTSSQESQKNNQQVKVVVQDSLNNDKKNSKKNSPQKKSKKPQRKRKSKNSQVNQSQDNILKQQGMPQLQLESNTQEDDSQVNVNQLNLETNLTSQDIDNDNINDSMDFQDSNPYRQQKNRLRQDSD